MLLFVPYICFALIFLIIYNLSNESRAQHAWAASLLSTSLIWAVLLTAITELLSSFRCLTPGWVLLLWSLAAIASALIYFTMGKRLTPPMGMRDSSSLSSFLVFSLFAVASICATLAVIAVIAAPNTWDSMVYHLPRVAHWIQNRSVSHYPTPTISQLLMSPLAEYHILHLQLLAGNDRFAALPQWFSMLGCLIGVSLVTKELGGGLRAQIFSAVVASTIPMGILQATSTQNDYVLSFWLVCFTYNLILFSKTHDHIRLLLGGTALGLALLTKGTAYLYAFPFLVWLVAYSLGSRLFRLRLYRPLLTVALIAATINLGHYYRNTTLFGSPLGAWSITKVISPPQGRSSKILNDVFNMRTLFSNVIRNVALHIGTKDDRANRLMEKSIRLVHRAFDIDVNDPRTTYPGAKFRIVPLATGDGAAGNPLHLILVFGFIATSLIRRSFGGRTTTAYTICIISAFLLFCLFTKWQPWGSRLHLPLFVLWSPCLGILVGSIRRAKLGHYIVVALLMSSLLWVCYNRHRPLIGADSILVTDRTKQYFNQNKTLMRYCVAAAELVGAEMGDKKELRVGLAIPRDFWEYPFWVLFKKNVKGGLQIEHLDVRNVSRKSSVARFNPDVVVCVECNRRKYRKNFGNERIFGQIHVFMR